MDNAHNDRDLIASLGDAMENIDQMFIVVGALKGSGSPQSVCGQVYLMNNVEDGSHILCGPVVESDVHSFFSALQDVAVGTKPEWLTLLIVGSDGCLGVEQNTKTDVAKVGQLTLEQGRAVAAQVHSEFGWDEMPEDERADAFFDVVNTSLLAPSGGLQAIMGVQFHAGCQCEHCGAVHQADPFAGISEDVVN